MMILQNEKEPSRSEKKQKRNNWNQKRNKALFSFNEKAISQEGTENK